MKKNSITGEELQNVIKKTFGVDKPTPEQIKYVITMLSPSAYGLAHHRIKGQPMTFSQSSRLGNPNAHRPWQKQIIDDKHPNKVIIKARQLGLSEVGVLEMLWFADSHSADAVKCLYTFPTVTQLQSFIQTRLDPNLHQGYYNDILDPNIDSLKQKKIRNSFMIFRTSSKSGAVEGVDIDYLSLDEYDRVPKAAEQSAIESMSSSNFKVVRRWSTPKLLTLKWALLQ